MRKVLVTAGPTREYIDDVRFISNASSGQMGYAVAKAAAEAGHHVVLVSGPVERDAPCGVDLVRVTSALEMREAVLEAFPNSDCVIMTAAVADYRPAKRSAGKLKKTRDALALDLVRNPDILAELGQQKGNRLLIGFALEATDGEKNAMEKLQAKNLDYIVLNSPAALGAESADVAIIGRDGSHVELPGATKADIAHRIVKVLESR